MNTNIDTVAFFQLFFHLRDEKIITPEQCSSMIKEFTSKPSFGPGSLKRNELSFNDTMDAFKELPKYFDNNYSFTRVLKQLHENLITSMNINKN